MVDERFRLWESVAKWAGAVVNPQSEMGNLLVSGLQAKYSRNLGVFSLHGTRVAVVAVPKARARGQGQGLAPQSFFLEAMRDSPDARLVWSAQVRPSQVRPGVVCLCLTLVRTGQECEVFLRICFCFGGTLHKTIQNGRHANRYRTQGNSALSLGA